MIEISEIATRLAENIEPLCKELLPRGRRIGNEWRVGSIHGESGKSLGVRLVGDKAGIWCDFKTDEKGDALDLIQSVHGCDKGTAVNWAKTLLGINGSAARVPTATKTGLDDGWKIITPVPLDAGKAPTHPEYGAPSQRWFYRDSNGAIVAIICRFERPEGKTIRPITYWRRPGGSCGWEWRQHPAPRPLYGLQRLAKISSATVHIAEGEKSADAAQALFKEEPCISWMGGSKAVGKTDWSPLAGRTVLVWPDNDEPGRDAANAVCRVCIDAGAREVRVVNLPENFPEKWDLAEPVPDGQPDDILERLQNDARPFVTNVTAAGPSWEHPDLSVLQGGRRSPPTFPFDLWREIWRSWIIDTARSKSAPPDYVAGSLLATAASLIGNARRVSPWPSWSEPSILWIGNVGNPSSGKSPSLDTITGILADLEEEKRPEHENEMARWEAAKEAAKIKEEKWKDDVRMAVDSGKLEPAKPDSAVVPDEPLRPRFTVTDTTPERLGQLLAAHPKGFLLQRDELAGWINGMDRYGGGTGERALWLEAYGGRPYTIDRVKHGNSPIRIPHLSVSIIGGIVPERIPAIMGGEIDDGLAARFIFLWPEPVGVERPKAIADNVAARNALRRLCDLEMGQYENGLPVPVELLLTDEAAEIFEKWWKKNAEDERSASGLHRNHLGKLPGILLRTALVLEHLWWCARDETPAPTNISGEAIAYTADFVDEYLKPMNERVCGDAALPDEERHAAAIARRIVYERAATINTRTIQRVWRLPGLRKADAIKHALEVLETAACIRPVPSRDSNHAGRQKSDYEVNPLLLEIG